MRTRWRIAKVRYQTCYGILAAVCAIGFLSTRSQGQIASVKLRGRVVDSLTHAPITGASIEIRGTELRQISDSAGEFGFVAIPAGEHLLRVRHVGYLPSTQSIALAKEDSIEHVIMLRHVPVELGEVVISGRPVTFPRFFEEAYKRAARGSGVYFTREDIEDWNVNEYKSLLGRIPGVSANDRGVTFNRCQSGLEAATNPRARPKVQVYVDGHRMAIDADDFRGIYAALSSVKPRQIQIMEVYPSLSSIPAEFLADACAVVVIWTRRD